MIKRVLVVVFTLLSCLVFAQQIEVVSVVGNVQYKKGGEGSWITVSQGAKVNTNDLIFTGLKSTAVLRMKNSTVDVKPLTQIVISALVDGGSTITTNIALKSGQVKAKVEKMDDVKNLFTISTTNTTASVRGTEFSFGNDVLIVEKGSVKFTDPFERSFLVGGGEEGSFNSLDGNLSSPKNNSFKGHAMNSSIAGMSNGESDNVTGVNGAGNGNAQLIINIKVK